MNGETKLAATVALAWALGAGCATPPKPPELDAFEKLRANPSATAAAKRSPDLVNNADRWLQRAREEWEDNELEKSVHSSLMGQIKLKEAMALAEQDRARTRAAAAAADLERSSDEHARLQKELAALNEQVALLKRLQEQGVERKKLEEQLTTENAKGTAAQKLSDAELAVKTADTVNAKKYAPAQHTAATDLIARAQQELKQNNFSAAAVSAEMAKKKADEAAEVAKPLYQQEAESAANRARAEDLARDAAAIPGVMVRRDSRGSLQRLVLPLRADELFVRREVTVSPTKGAVLDSVANLLKKYPNYPVQVVGHTDNRGKSSELLAMSQARAHSVSSSLIQRGVDAKRVAVSGLGPAEPLSDNRTLAGRAQNNRVEIIFLYQ